MQKSKTKLWYLKNLDVFKHISDEDRRRIESTAVQKGIRRNETLYFLGAQNDSVYILKEGAVKVIRHLSDGREAITEILGFGTVFGESSVSEAGERNETAVVAEDGVICTIRKRDFNRLVETIPGLKTEVRKMQGHRRYKLENRLLDMLFCTVDQRLARTIVGLMEDFGERRQGRYVLKVKLTHQDFARLVASTRETVTATFRKLREQGLLDFENKYVVVPSLKRLREATRNEP